jgi:hypothetical protein
MGLTAIDLDCEFVGPMGNGTLRQNIAAALAGGGIGVTSTISGDGARITCTVGYHGRGAAEMLVVGLPTELATQLLAEFHMRMVCGARTLVLNEQMPMLEGLCDGCVVVVRRMHAANQWALQPTIDYHRVAVDTPVRAMQMFWPDRVGRYPWDESCCPDVQRRQLRLDLARTSDGSPRILN